MADEREYQTPRWRMLGLAIAFSVLVAIGVATVLLPELEDEPTVDVSSEDAKESDTSEQ